MYRTRSKLVQWTLIRTIRHERNNSIVECNTRNARVFGERNLDLTKSFRMKMFFMSLVVIRFISTFVRAPLLKCFMSFS